MTTHRYESSLSWSGETNDYASYRREHVLTLGETQIAASADAAFRGDSSLTNPEQLVVAAASSCQLLSFLAVAAVDGVNVVAYSDQAVGEMSTEERPMRLTRITLRPRIKTSGATADRVERLVTKAHEQC